MCGLPTIHRRFTLLWDLEVMSLACGRFAFRNAQEAGKPLNSKSSLIPISEPNRQGSRKTLLMEPKRSKYDTNPLDENVADRAKQSWGQTSSETSGSPTEGMGRGSTQNVGRPDDTVQGYSESEAPTRRIDESLGTSYPSIFVPPTSRPSVTYQPPRVTVSNIYQPPTAPPPNIYQPPPMPVTYRPG